MGWKLDFIKNIFLAFEAEWIAIINLTERLPPYKLLWPHIRNGRYSVRSGYHLPVEIQDRQWIQGASDSEIEDGGRGSGNYNCQKKIKTFPWGTFHDTLPRKTNFVHKVDPETSCSSCNMGTEDLRHTSGLQQQLRCCDLLLFCLFVLGPCITWIGHI